MEEVMEGRKNRTRLDIMANILSITMTNTKKTHIMYKANLSYRQLQEYLEFLIRKNLLRYGEDGDFYKTSGRGVEFLKSFQVLKDSLMVPEDYELEAVEMGETEHLDMAKLYEIARSRKFKCLEERCRLYDRCPDHHDFPNVDRESWLIQNCPKLRG